MRRMLVGLIMVPVLAAIASTAVACINDEELPSHEREFRSSYAAAGSPSPPSAGFDGPLGQRMLINAGVVLLSGGVAVAFFRGRART